MLKTTILPKKYWTEVAENSYYIINRSLSIVIEMKTHIEMWIGMPANYSSLHIFWVSCLCDI